MHRACIIFYLCSNACTCTDSRIHALIYSFNQLLTGPIIRNKQELVNEAFLNIIETIMHCAEQNIEHILIYFSYHLKDHYNRIPFTEHMVSVYNK